MSEENLKVLKRAFREYYYQRNSVEIPTRIDEREFGYLPFGGYMTRHLLLRKRGELTALLVRESPRGVYASCSYYDDPSLPMAEKGWKSGDLAFDIDCDDLEMDCKQEHDRWTCKSCSRIGKGIRPTKCPSCANTKILTLNWSCNLCLNASKGEVIKLREILLKDFGMKKGKISTFFSGNKGYHLTIESSEFDVLDQRGRGEMANYIRGKGLDIQMIGLSKRADYNDMVSRLPVLGEPGWRGKIASFFDDYEFEGRDNEKDIKSKIAGYYSRSTPKKFNEVIDSAIKRHGSRIDSGVTIDIHRIFRLAGSLHEKTGLSKKRCEDIDSFDPTTDPVEIKDEPIKVHVNMSPPFTLKERTYGPYKSEEVTLPLYAGVYLMANNLAQVANSREE